MRKSMARVLWIFVLSLSLSAPLVRAAQAGGAESEEWKGAPDPALFHVGVLTGLGILDSDAGFEALGTFSRKIQPEGFVPDINDAVSLELQAGPIFIRSATGFSYSLHLRWDFRKDEDWSLYAVGGIGGHITGESLGSRFLLFPRFGLGALRHLAPGGPSLRFELSHERISVGVLFDF